MRVAIAAAIAVAVAAGCASEGSVTDAVRALATQPCLVASDIAASSAVADDRRAEAMVEYLTGVDESSLEEGAPMTFDGNFGGVWGVPGGDGWVAALVDCDLVDLDELVSIGGGSDEVQVIQVPYSFDEVTSFRDVLASDLADSGIPGDIVIDSTVTGRWIRVVVEDVDALPATFGQAVPSASYRVVEGEIAQAE